MDLWKSVRPPAKDIQSSYSMCQPPESLGGTQKVCLIVSLIRLVLCVLGDLGLVISYL